MDNLRTRIATYLSALTLMACGTERVVVEDSSGAEAVEEPARARDISPDDLDMVSRGGRGAPGGRGARGGRVAPGDTAAADAAALRDLATPPPDAETTASGLISKKLSDGHGREHPTVRDSVVVHYTGWTTAGEMFDTSRDRRPASFRLSALIAGWTEGLQLMVVGERRRLWIPEDLAYQGRPGAPAGMLVFDVELLEIHRAPVPLPVPAAPPDVAGPPSDADRTSSGLASKVLEPGQGTAHPAISSRVTVHYTGWTTDGQMFDTSLERGEPTTFSVDRVIAGWAEGVQLMVVGEKRRLWIPESLAYQGRPGAPQGMLVFDIELLAIEN